jgi:aspartate/methionine/tyrosine aminotransferase
MADLHWPTLSEIAGDQGVKVVGYDHANPSLAEAVSDVIGEVNPAHVAAVLLNYPLNPTSRGIEKEQLTAFMAAMDAINSAKGTNIHVILDMPYSYACPPDKDEKGRFLKTGAEHVFGKKWKTVVSGIISFSKFLSAAPLGTSILFTFGDARDLSRRLSVGGLGIARNELYIRSLAKVIDGTHDELLWAHNDALREKYVLNRKALEDAFGERVYPGMPNVLSLVSIPAGEVFGRVVTCCDGEKRVLKNGYDVVEYLANNHGIAVVANGVKDGNMLMRIAQREEYKAFAPGLKSLVAGLQEIRQAPVHKDERVLSVVGG